MSKVVEMSLTIGLRIGKLTPPDTQMHRTPQGEQHAERRAPGSGEPGAARISEPSGGVVYGCVRDESRRRRRPPPGGSTKVGKHGGRDARSAGAPQGAKEATRRETGCGPEEYGRLRSEGYSGSNRVLPRLAPHVRLPLRQFSTAPGDSDATAWKCTRSLLLPLRMVTCDAPGDRPPRRPRRRPAQRGHEPGGTAVHHRRPWCRQDPRAHPSRRAPARLGHR